ncbi:Retrotransposon gag protein [Ascosphaera apis ARSEF 7405]|uniref:Retrotransposon gag protein n=1 Tax=Ascosphaera apis ARSEF 7405 TaxID=392613 RepID=A0A162IDA3_9EURO|nr:Retrotransposon gag protein [Ascosphaera apis ARSEF 7405]
MSSEDSNPLDQIMGAIAGLQNQLLEQRQQANADLRSALAAQNDDIRSEFITALNDQRRDLHNEVAELRSQLAALRPQSTTATSSAPSPAPAPVSASGPSSSPDKVVKIPDPAVFSGSRDDLSRWTAQVKVKLSVNASHFPNEESRIGYLFSRLSGAAAQQLLPFFASGSGSSSLSSVAEFFQVLENAFGDPDRKTTAQNKLESLYQRNKEFAVHYAEFQRTAADCCYDDEALKSRLRRSLSHELQYALAMVPESEISSYTSLVYRCQQLDNNLRAVTNNTRSHTSAARPRPSSGPVVSSPVIAPRYTPSPVVPRPAPAPAPRAAPAVPRHDPMEIDASGPRGPLTEAERQRRRSGNLCLYCGQSGHFRVNCPSRPPRANVSAAVSNPSTAMVVRPASPASSVAPSSVAGGVRMPEN